MAKILYGVAGEGFGHSSRSELFGRRLIEAGHEVMFAASRKSLAYLTPAFGQRVQQVYGLSFYYRDGRVCPMRTLRQNIAGYPRGFATNRRLFSKQVRQFKPDLVISDFEPFSAWWAFRHRVPCLSVDHEHLLTLGRLDSEPRYRTERWMAKIVTYGYHTFADAYIVLNFFEVPLRGGSSVLAPPVVRPAVLAIPPSQSEHITVYSTDASEPMRQKVITCLNRFERQRFFVYGFNDDAAAGNCTLKKTSTEGFLRDLASCRGVIATAGFSLLSECLHFNKRMLLMPVQDQYEQIVNAYYVEKLGLGMRTETLTDEAVAAFLDTLDKPTPAGGVILKPDNERVIAAIDRQAANAGIPLGLFAQ